TDFCASPICFSISFFFGGGGRYPDVAAVARWELSEAAISSLALASAAERGVSFSSIAGLALRWSGARASWAGLERIQRIWPDALSRQIRSAGSAVTKIRLPTMIGHETPPFGIGAAQRIPCAP